MTDRRALAKSAELIRGRWPFVLAILFTLLPFGAGPASAQEGSGVRQVVLAILFLSAAFAIIRFPERLAMVRQGMPLSFILLLLYIMLSVGWSPDPWVSFKRAVQVVGVVVLGLAVLVGGNGRTRVERLLPPLLLVVMIVAIAFTAAFPGFAFADNGWRAFMATKNNLGQITALCILFPLFCVATGSRKRALWFGLSLVGLVGLVLTRSETTAISVLSVGAAYAVAYAARRLDSSWWQVLLVGAMGVVITGFGLGLCYGFPSIQEAATWILKPTGRDLTLTGRTYLWQLVIDQAMRHPWFGAGYGGFWLGLDGPSGQIAYLVKWGYPGQAHNGYLDLFNELGIVGCLLVTWFILEHARNVLRLIRTNWRVGMIHGSILIMMLVVNLGEAALLRTTHIWWMIFVASVIEVKFLTMRPLPTTAEVPRPVRVGVPA